MVARAPGKLRWQSWCLMSAHDVGVITDQAETAPPGPDRSIVCVETASSERNAMSINASSIVYVYGDQFVELRRRGGAQLPCRDVRVKKQDLAATAMTAALIGLAEAGHARLYLGTRRALLRKRSAVFVEPLRGTQSIGGLEGGLLASLGDDQKSNTVRTIIERLLPLSGDPWGDVMGRIEEGMLEEGYFLEVERDKKIAKFFLGKKLDPDCPRIAALQEQVLSVREMVDGFRQANQVLYDQLIKDVRQGIRARQDVDVDID
jgi:hypothetical protein